MLRTVAAVVAGGCLLTCLVVPVFYFRGAVTEQTYHWLFAVASAGWFVSATVFVTAKRG